MPYDATLASPHGLGAVALGRTLCSHNAHNSQNDSVLAIMRIVRILRPVSYSRAKLRSVTRCQTGASPHGTRS